LTPATTIWVSERTFGIRRELKLGEGSFAWLPQFTNDRALGYRNGGILVVHNFGTDALSLPAGEVILRSIFGGDASHIAPNETVWVSLDK
jgi:alpha-glucosidase